MISELAEKIIKETSSQSKYEVNYSRPWDRSGRRLASIEKTKNEIGFTTHTSINEGISKTVDWFKNNLDLIEKCINRNVLNP
jgi:nucleoside-diphosphate-sugar epimerase